VLENVSWKRVVAPLKPTVLMFEMLLPMTSMPLTNEDIACTPEVSEPIIVFPRLWGLCVG
jgi:hypothetical protein